MRIRAIWYSPYILSFNLLSLFQPSSWITSSAKLRMSLSRKIMKRVAHGRINLFKFNATRIQLCCLSHKSSLKPHLISMLNVDLPDTDYLFLEGVAFDQNFLWRNHIISLRKSAAKNNAFFFRVRKYFSPVNPWIIPLSQSLQFSSKAKSEHCSHI